MSGYEVADRLRADREIHRTLVVAVSGYGQEEDKLRALEAGCDLHMTKPVDPIRLGALMASARPPSGGRGDPANGARVARRRESRRRRSLRRKRMAEAGEARRRGPAIRLAVAGVLLLAGWGAWRLWEVRRHRRGLAEARAEMQAGRHGHAVRTLLDLAAGGPVRDEAAYLLGACEKARGRDQAAAEAWARVAPDSPFAARAIQGLMELHIQAGRLSDAERLVERALDDPRIDAGALRVFLGMIYSLEGRVEDGERLVEANWRRLDQAGQGASERAVQLARLHVVLRQETASTEAMRSYLDHAARLARDDDRVWLGQARLAIRTGALDEAAPARRMPAAAPRRPRRLAQPGSTGHWRRAASTRPAPPMAHLPASEVPESQVRSAVGLAGGPAWRREGRDRSPGAPARRRSRRSLRAGPPGGTGSPGR